MAGKKWLDSEFIIWKVETTEEIKKMHPDWPDERVNAFLSSLAMQLYNTKQITKEQLFTI